MSYNLRLTLCFPYTLTLNVLNCIFHIFVEFYMTVHAYGKKLYVVLKYFASPFEINEFFE